MSASQSDLSDKGYGYDFVVATTQASINSGLKEYLYTAQEPETILCCVADAGGQPSVIITLTELLARTNNINPFDIPNDTPYSDPRVQVMGQVGFWFALRLKLGLPPGIMPSALPPLVTLGFSADEVRFNTLCSEIQIAQRLPYDSVWGAWSQPNGQAWYFNSTVDLVNADLDKELDTPYFNSHPAEKAALLAQLENLGSEAFSLQQLLFDLDSAALQTTPQLEGLDPTSPAAFILTHVFISTYFNLMKQNGSPVLSVHAVSSTPDHSSLQLTSLERQVGPPLDANGQLVINPTPEQAEAATLIFLCAANNNPLPPTNEFTWNWVDVADVDSMSGVIAIKRNTLAAFYKDNLLAGASQCCVVPFAAVAPNTDGNMHYSFTLTPGGTPNCVVTDPGSGGANVLTISYDNAQGAHAYYGMFMVQFNLHTYYTCTVSFSGNTITITQNLRVNVYFSCGPGITQGDVVNRTITDTYTLSIGDDGKINYTPTSASQNHDCDPRSLYPGMAPTDDQDIVQQISSYAYQLASIIKPVPAQDIQSFVFPGGKVFTYKDVRFSDHQDLVSSVTYLAPHPASATPHRTGVPVL